MEISSTTSVIIVYFFIIGCIVLFLDKHPKLHSFIFNGFLIAFLILLIAIVIGAVTGWWDLGPWIDKFL